MKYAVIILAGASDEPADALGGKTPLEAASMPNVARLAAKGRVGAALTIPDDLQPSPELGVLSVLGCDPLEYPVGRAALEAASMGVAAGPREWVLRCSFVTIGEVEEEAGVLIDPAPQALTGREARVLMTDLLEHWRAALPQLAAGLSIAGGTGTGMILIDASGADYRSTTTLAPAALWQQPAKDHLPGGGAAASRLRRLMDASQPFLSRHEVNLARAEQGLRPANLAWLWGAGTSVKLPPFTQRFRVRAVMFAGDDAVGGLAVAMGMDRLPAFCGLDDDPLGLAALAGAMSDTLRRADLVCCYVEEPLRATLRGDHHAKVHVLEELDAALIGPLAHDLDESYADPALDPAAEGWRMLIICDTAASTAHRRHAPGPVPFMMAGAWVRSVMERPFTEAAATESDLQVDAGHELMEYFLRGGLASVRAR